MTETKTAAAPKAAKNPSTIDYRSRESRKPLTGMQQRLAADIPEGFVGRWVNDEPGRIQRFYEAGWKHATRGEKGIIREKDEYDREGAIYEEHVMASANGQSVRGYLMLIPKDLYEEDKRRSQALLDEREEVAQSGQGVGMGAGDHVYVPEGFSNKIRDTLAKSNSEE